MFTPLFAEYQRNPRLVRERIYREALTVVMGQIGKRDLLPPRARPGDVRIWLSEGEGAP